MNSDQSQKKLQNLFNLAFYKKQGRWKWQKRRSETQTIDVKNETWTNIENQHSLQLNVGVESTFETNIEDSPNTQTSVAKAGSPAENATNSKNVAFRLNLLTKFHKETWEKSETAESELNYASLPLHSQEDLSARSLCENGPAADDNNNEVFAEMGQEHCSYGRATSEDWKWMYKGSVVTTKNTFESNKEKEMGCDSRRNFITMGNNHDAPHSSNKYGYNNMEHHYHNVFEARGLQHCCYGGNAYVNEMSLNKNQIVFLGNTYGSNEENEVQDGAGAGAFISVHQDGAQVQDGARAGAFISVHQDGAQMGCDSRRNFITMGNNHDAPHSSNKYGYNNMEHHYHNVFEARGLQHCCYGGNAYVNEMSLNKNQIVFLGNTYGSNEENEVKSNVSRCSFISFMRDAHDAPHSSLVDRDFDESLGSINTRRLSELSRRQLVDGFNKYALAMQKLWQELHRRDEDRKTRFFNTVDSSMEGETMLAGSYVITSSQDDRLV